MNKIQELELPLRLMKINCQTCKGKQEIGGEYEVGICDAESKYIYGDNPKLIPCPKCEGKGYTEVERL